MIDIQGNEGFTIVQEFGFLAFQKFGFLVVQKFDMTWKLSKKYKCMHYIKYYYI